MWEPSDSVKARLRVIICTFVFISDASGGEQEKNIHYQVWKVRTTNFLMHVLYKNRCKRAIQSLFMFLRRRKSGTFENENRWPASFGKVVRIVTQGKVCCHPGKDNVNYINEIWKAFLKRLFSNFLLELHKEPPVAVGAARHRAGASGGGKGSHSVVLCTVMVSTPNYANRCLLVLKW